MNEEVLALLFVTFLLGGVWLDALRAREMAVGVARRSCKARGLQLLDQTVALQRMRLRWTGQGVRIYRSYRFEVSSDGIDRHPARLALLGIDLQWIDLSETMADDTGPEPQTEG